MTVYHRLTLIVVLASASTLCAQPPGNRPADTNPPATPPSATQPPDQNSGQDGTRRANAGTGRDLEVERGSIPGLFSRERGQNSSSDQQGQRSSGGRGQTSAGQREFIKNALRFDANSDRQLAANELANLFHVLASSQQRQTSITQPQQTAATAVSSQITTTTSIQTDANLIQRESVRQALVLFLQLALQFDANGDGLLSQPELFNLASSLLANDMGLLNAATQPAGRRSTTTSTSRNAIQSGNAIVNQNISRGKTNRLVQSGSQFGGTGQRSDRGDGRRMPDRPRRDRSSTESNDRTGGSGAAESVE